MVIYRVTLQTQGDGDVIDGLMGEPPGEVPLGREEILLCSDLGVQTRF